MKAIQIQRFGGPEVLELAEVERPAPGPGEVLIRVAGAGVNFADLNQRAGKYLFPQKLPLIPGFEASGTVVAAGKGAELLAVDRSVLEPGTRVFAGAARSAYAEYAIVPADVLYRVPDAMSLVEAAGIPVNFQVAWIVLHRKAQLQQGQTVLVHAAGGGVGSAVVQLAKLAGAYVIATASSAAKLAVAAELGADLCINYSSGFRDQIRESMRADRPVDLVVDSVGGGVLVESLELIRPWGRYVGFGQASGKAAELDAYASAIPNHLDIGFFGRGLIASSREPSDRALLREATSRAVALWSSRKIRCARLTRLALADAAEAHRRFSSRGLVGKLVLEAGAD
ncbi:MAG: NADPH:quinone oxidoreductase family protein [Betaproteobacteria bacterium]|nr:MAG: NADPH:quinone oxidoreductase family protein [Betaproteobacteria bacterium]